MLTCALIIVSNSRLLLFLSPSTTYVPYIIPAPVHAAAASVRSQNPIFGKAEIDVDYMYEYVCRHNPKFQREVAEAFYNVGERYGIRGDIALCQAIIETGWFRFDNGTAVQPNAHNYCGLG